MSVDRVHLRAEEVETYANFACELADLAAAEILPRFRTTIEVDNKGSSGSLTSDLNEKNPVAKNPQVKTPVAQPGSKFDPVTIADKAAEAVMRNRIRSAFPGHGILGEEHGLLVGESGLTWVLDPIDGTRAFITGLPLWGCLIALFDGVEPVLGVMDQPFLGERYIATGSAAHCIESKLHGYGATAAANVSEPLRSGSSALILKSQALETRALNKQPLKTRGCVTLGDAVMMTTSPDMFKSKFEQSAFFQLADTVRMHRFGGDCYAYCMLARGFVDLVVEADLQPYDIQALIPLVKGAGGVITNWQGDSARAGGQIVAAATPELHHQALTYLSASAGT